MRRDKPVDPAADRAPRATAAIFDLDGTITRYGTYTPFVCHAARHRPAKFLYALPIAVAALATHAGLLSRGRLKELMLEAVLGGAPLELVREYAEDFTRRWVEGRLRPGAVAAIEHHRDAGDRLILATASFEFYAACFARRLGFDTVVATRTLCASNGTMSGKIDGENCRGAAKLRRVRAAVPDLKRHFHVVAYSDHEVDLPLLRWADTAVAVNPTAQLGRQAATEGFAIVDWNVA